MPSTNLKVLTYNVHKGFSSFNTRFVLGQIRNALELLDCDVVVLQEIQGKHRRKALKVEDWPTETQFEYLADRLWPHHAYGKNAVYQAGHHGNAILSKYPFLLTENINVSRSTLFSRGFLHGVVELGHGLPSLHVVGVHLALTGLERSRQLKLLKKRLLDHVPESEPLIVAGDFNDWSLRADGHLGGELGLEEAFYQAMGDYAKTVPSWFPFLKLDRIYYRGLNIEKAVCLEDNEWKKLSDHLPLYVEFSLP